MPKTTTKRGGTGQPLTNGTRQAAGEELNDDEGEPSSSAPRSSQVTQTQAEKVLMALSQDEVKRLVSDLVIYLLIADQKKLPIKRADINKNVLKDNKKAFLGLMKRAKQKLEQVFGIRLVELENGSYVLVNNLDNLAADDLDEKDHAKTGLVTVILSLIFMRCNQIGEDELFEALRKLGVDVDQPHEVFGDVRKLITTEFTRQGYLDTEKQAAVDPPKFIFKWGPRAHAETTKRDVLEFVCSVYGTSQPSEWPMQYRDVLESEKVATASG